MKPILTKIQFLVMASFLSQAIAQQPAVVVTASLDATTINSGQTTTLRIFAQVAPAVRPSAERIFSWYVDVLNTNAPAASANFNAMVKPASDNDPLISSTGLPDGAHRRGIFDTFLDLPGAGVAAPVQLMTIPVTGLAAGKTRFEVKAGSGVPALFADFIVAPTGGGDPLTGGDYTLATADLEVLQGCFLLMQITPLNNGAQLRMNFTPCAGFNHTVEFLDVLVSNGNWQPLPGAPHNTGQLTVNRVLNRQYYRVKALPQ